MIKSITMSRQYFFFILGASPPILIICCIFYLYHLMPFSPVGKKLLVAQAKNADGGEMLVVQWYMDIIEPYNVRFFYKDGEAQWHEFFLAQGKPSWKAALEIDEETKSCIIIKDGSPYKRFYWDTMQIGEIGSNKFSGDTAYKTFSNPHPLTEFAEEKESVFYRSRIVQIAFLIFLLIIDAPYALISIIVHILLIRYAPKTTLLSMIVWFYVALIAGTIVGHLSILFSELIGITAFGVELLPNTLQSIFIGSLLGIPLWLWAIRKHTNSSLENTKVLSGE